MISYAQNWVYLTQVGESAESGNWWATIIGWFKNPEDLLLTMGPWVLLGVALIVFIESGVLFPILPGDSLIFAAGLLHVQLGLNLWLLVGTILVCAFLGSQVGYWIGRRWGRGLFKPDAKILKLKYLHQAEAFFSKYGGRSLILGRFVPFVRTFVPITAGAARFPFGRFVGFNTLGAIIWGAGITFAGAALGDVPFVHDNLEVIIILIVVASLIPMVVEVMLQRRRAQRELKDS